jgi:hypothetical protein
MNNKRKIEILEEFSKNQQRKNIIKDHFIKVNFYHFL